MDIEARSREIKDKISQLSQEKQQSFRDLLYDSMNDRGFCRDCGIDYAHVDKEPHITRAREVLYNLFFAPQSIKVA